MWIDIIKTALANPRELVSFLNIYKFEIIHANIFHETAV